MVGHLFGKQAKHNQVVSLGYGRFFQRQPSATREGHSGTGHFSRSTVLPLRDVGPTFALYESIPRHQALAPFGEPSSGSYKPARFDS